MFYDDDEDQEETVEATVQPLAPQNTSTISFDDDDMFDDDDEEEEVQPVSQPTQQPIQPTAQQSTIIVQAPVKDDSLASLEAENAKLKARLLEEENAKLRAQLEAKQKPSVGLNTGIIAKKPEQQQVQQKPTTAQTPKDNESEQIKRWQRYDQMKITDLWKYVFRFMTAMGVKQHPIKPALLEKEFGHACVKKLEQSYIIKTKDGYTC